MTPNRLVALMRLAATGSAIGLTVLLLGPFQGLEQVFHLTDKEAHALAFFGVTLGLFAIAPGWRRTDLALAALSFGLFIELAQGLTGRSVSLLDLMADGVGVLAALAPGLVERLRHHVRTSPDIDFATIRAMDRRAPQPSAAGEPRVAASETIATSTARLGV